jgi:hypothetical protein
VAENGEIVGSVSQTAPFLILVHDDVEPPVQPIFDALMRANDLVEAFGRQSCAEKIIGGFGRCLAGGFADALDLADSGQARPLMVFDQPRDIGRDRGRAAMVGLDGRLGGDRFAGGIVEIQNDVLMKRSLISLQGQGVVAALIDDLLGDGALGN